MRLRAFTSVLVTAAALVVAPTASPASHSYTAGHFLLSLDGEPALVATDGAFARDGTFVLRGGTASPALEAWLSSRGPKTVTVGVHNSEGEVVRYNFYEAWPVLDGERLTLAYRHVSSS